MRSLPLGLICGALMLASSATWAGPPAPPAGAEGPPQPHDLVREHASALGIDADTVEAIQRIAGRSGEERQVLAVAVQQARGTLSELLQEDEPERAAVMAQVEALGVAETAVLRHHLTTLLDIHELLTPEQVQALEAMAPSGPAGGPAGGAPGGPPGGGPPPPGHPPPGMPGGR